MFDILNIWNNTNKSTTGEQNLNAFKRKIQKSKIDFQNVKKLTVIVVNKVKKSNE